MGKCWCLSKNTNIEAREVCGHPSGYSGEYARFVGDDCKKVSAIFRSQFRDWTFPNSWMMPIYKDSSCSCGETTSNYMYGIEKKEGVYGQVRYNTLSVSGTLQGKCSNNVAPATSWKRKLAWSYHLVR